MESWISSTLSLLLENPVVVDVETTTKNKGNAFTEDNILCMIQVKVGQQPPLYFVRGEFEKVIPILNSASCLITFNGKFDLHWLKRELGFEATVVWDVQLAEFLFSSQQWKYPDLAATCEKYGVTKKLDIIHEQYWSKGIDTTEIPVELLAEYGCGDVQSTYECFEKQVEQFRTTEQRKFKLFRIHCNDLIVLEEMEYNGIKYDVEGSLAKSAELDRQIQHLEDKLNDFTGGVPINFGSRDHVSALLYGGKVVEEQRIPIGVYKTGAKVGQPRYKVVEQVYELPRLVDPLKGSELKKEGLFATDEATLLSLRPKATAKKIIQWLLDRSKLTKLRSTYLEGMPGLITTMGWGNSILHPNYNQCMAETGRLSSTKPNAQNLPPECKNFCITRY